MSFREIKERVPNFDQDVCNTFEKNEFDCFSSICNEKGIDIDENNDLWDRLEIKGLFLFKVVFGDDLLELRLTCIPNISQQL